MTKIVYSSCYGGFGLSRAAAERYAELKQIDPSNIGLDDTRYDSYGDDIDRTDPILVQVVEELGREAASGAHAELEIRELPAGTKYKIDEYDGFESVVTIDEYEWSVA